MPLSLGPPAQTPCLIYLCIYLPPSSSSNPNTGPQNTPKVHRGKEKGEGEKERWGGGEKEGEKG